MLWYYMLPNIIQWQIQQNWGMFKLAISSHFMNQQWFNRMKGWILHMRYWQNGHKNKFPTNYVYCKLCTIHEVFVLTPSETIMEIMNSMLHYWRILIDTAWITTIHKLQDLLKYHKENLMKDPNCDKSLFFLFFPIFGLGAKPPSVARWLSGLQRRRGGISLPVRLETTGRSMWGRESASYWGNSTLQ